MLQKVQRGDYPPPRQINPKVPAAPEAVCRKAMALRPADRYPTARALAGDIEKVAGRRAGRRLARAVACAGRCGDAAAPKRSWRRRPPGCWWRFWREGRALWYQQDQAARATASCRASATASGVNAALDEAEGLDKQAAGLKDDPVRWQQSLSEAMSAVKRAEGLLDSGEGTDDLRRRVAAGAGRARGGGQGPAHGGAGGGGSIAECGAGPRDRL